MGFIGTIDKGSFGSRLADQMGKGLQSGYETGKEEYLKRYRETFEGERLKDSLSNLKKEISERSMTDEPMTEFELASNLYSIPGITAEQRRELYPKAMDYLSTASRLAAQKKDLGQSEIDKKTIAARKAYIPEVKERPIQPQTDFFTEEGELKQYVPRTFEEQQALAAEESVRENIPIEKAQKRVEKQEASRKQQFDVIDKQLEDAETTLNTQINKFLQEDTKDKYSYDLSGAMHQRLQSAMRQEVLKNIREGKPIKSINIANEYANIAKEIGKTNSAIARLGNSWSWDKRTVQNTVKDASKFYRRAGLQDELRNRLAKDLNIDDAYAAELANSAYKNPKVDKYIEKLGSFSNALTKEWDPNVIVKDIAERMTKEDSVGSIASRLNDIGYDQTDIITAFHDLSDQGFDFSEDQKEEMRIVTIPTMQQELNRLFYGLFR
ncbi:MAG: hypothetical protein PQJ44_06925 [Sphaerochaetaceae bacterium]|nr:hypothetical protein [Sphaerochaetaceae bacterium]